MCDNRVRLEAGPLATLLLAALLLAMWPAVAGARSVPAADDTAAAEAEPAASEGVVEEYGSLEEYTEEQVRQTPGGITAVIFTKDGQEWRDDPEKGFRYRLVRLPATSGWKWIKEGWVRMAGGAEYPVAKLDDRWIYVKIYEVQEFAPPPAPEQPQAPSPEDLARVAQQFESDVVPSDRIRLESFDEGLPQVGQWRNKFDIADMNEDGELDIVFGPARKGYALPNVFLGDGQGRWRHWREARYPRRPYDYGGAVVADFNGDGHQDIALGVHLRGLIVLVGDGQGTFQEWSDGIGLEMPGSGKAMVTFSSRAPGAIDWDADGKVDLLALGEGPKGIKQTVDSGRGARLPESRGFLLYANQGDGTWVPRILEQAPFDFGDDFTVADFDVDGKPDLAVANRRLGGREILRVGRTEDDLLRTEVVEGIRPDTTVLSVASDDFDGDGRSDLVVGFVSRQTTGWWTGIDLFYNKKGGWEGRTLIGLDSFKGVTSMGTGDLDGDGEVDLVALTGDGGTMIFLGDGKGFLTQETSPELPPPTEGCTGWDVHFADLDHDGADEVVASFAGEPTGMGTLPGLSFPGCYKEGRVTAWKAFRGPSPRPADPPPAEATDGAAAAGSP